MKIRLSYSSLNVLHGCPRKFQIEKLLALDIEREETQHTVFGEAFGLAVAHYLLTKDQESSIFKLFCRYNDKYQDERKNIWTCLGLLMSSFCTLDDLLEEWEVATYKGKPAVEISFKINGLSDMPEHDIYYVGFIDVILKNRFNGQYAVVDVKSTGLNLIDLSPIYKYSGQVLGYSIMLDAMAKELEESSLYTCIYAVGRIGRNPYKAEMEIYRFSKNLSHRLKWLLTIKQKVGFLETFLKYDHFPQEGSWCSAYRRTCRHFDFCDLTHGERYNENIVDTNVYDFEVSYASLVADYMTRTI